MRYDLFSCVSNGHGGLLSQDKDHISTVHLSQVSDMSDNTIMHQSFATTAPLGPGIAGA